MDISAVDKMAREGEKPNWDQLKRAIELLPEDVGPEPSRIVQEVGVNHPEYLATFSEQLGSVEKIKGDENAVRAMIGVVNAIKADPSAFGDYVELIESCLESGTELKQVASIKPIWAAARAGEDIPESIISKYAVAESEYDFQVVVNRVIFKGALKFSKLIGLVPFSEILAGYAIDGLLAFDEATRVPRLRSMVVSLNRGVSTLVLIVGVVLLTFGIPATLILGLSPRYEFIARFIISGGSYILGGVVLHPGAWELLPFTYPSIRAPMMASLFIVAGTAVWG